MRNVNPVFWHKRRVFVTGHTGFKGSWLCLWLQSMGAEVHGFSLKPPSEPALFVEAQVGAKMASTIGDIRDYAAVLGAMDGCKPDVVIHMAAQPLVRYSYIAPVDTYATNVMGTVHVLEAARHVGSVRAIVNITTDKCYENKEWLWGYREDEPMGGFDPYSNSKGCAELVTSAYRQSFFAMSGIGLASARAGNVIGGGDWALDRLIPDILRAFERGEPVSIRYPDATRPWQHVLEPLSGYLILAEQIYEDGQRFSEGWNFGPQDDDARPVKWIVEYMAQIWGDDAQWKTDHAGFLHEANYLKLDISKAKARLKWQPRWNLTTSLLNIIEWHQVWLGGGDCRAMCLSQISRFLSSTTDQHTQ